MAEQTSEKAAMRIGAFTLEVNEFGGLQQACLERIAEALVPGGAVLPVRLLKEEGASPRFALSAREDGIAVRATENGVFPALAELQARIVVKDGASYLSAGSAEEEARFSYRGVLVDDARHFQGAAAVKELLEVMFRLKFSVLHWHICDDQGFRLPLPGYPELSKAARRSCSYVGGHFRSHSDGTPYEGAYTEEEVREVLRCATERGIRVIPEVDMPGHHSAVLSCYPQFACGEGGSLAPRELPGRYGVLDNALCLGKKEARDFAKKLALDTARFLGSDTVHVGFDEIRKDHMRACPDCRREAERLGLKDPAALIPIFRAELRDYLKENGVYAMAWFDETAFDGPDPDMTVIHWRPESAGKVVDAINRGQKSVVSSFYHYYMDYPYAMTPLRKTYRFEPLLRGIEKPEYVIGTECTLWSEFIASPEKLRFNAYYRMAAASKTAWSRSKASYADFMKELREKEELWFGRKLEIPDELLDPPPGRAIRRLWTCFMRDSDHEVSLWKQANEGKEDPPWQKN